MFRTIFAAALALAVAVAAPVASAGDEPLEAALISGFEPFEPPAGPIRMPDGSTASLRDFPGELVLATVWFTTCPGCQVEMPRLAELSRILAAEGPANIRLLPISIDEVVFRESPEDAVARVERYYARKGLTGLPVALDLSGGNAAALFGADPVATPTTFFIGPDGRIVAVVQGSLADWAAPESLATLRRLAGG